MGRLDGFEAPVSGAGAYGCNRQQWGRAVWGMPVWRVRVTLAG